MVSADMFHLDSPASLQGSQRRLVSVIVVMKIVSGGQSAEYLQDQDGRDADAEFLFQSLVMEKAHAGQRTDGAQQKGHQDENAFADPPFPPLCTALIYAVEQEGQQIYGQKIE